MFKYSFAVIVILLILATILGLTSAAEVSLAQTWTVTTADDGALNSLRDLINRANNQTSAVTITFAISPVPISGSNGLKIKTGHSITIEGNTTSFAEVDGSIAAQPLITIEEGAILTLNDVILKNSQFGGVIENQANGNLTLNSVVVRDSLTDQGGGLRNYGNATIRRSSFLVNTAGYGNGGAIYNDKSLFIYNSTFYVNWTFGYGGAIYNDADGTAEIHSSTIVGNRANAQGGAIYNNNPTVNSLKVINSIISSSADSTNCGGSPLTLLGNNIQFPGTGCGPSLYEEPRLGTLTDDSLPILPLLSDSPAIDGVSSKFDCAGTSGNNVDEHASPRPLDGNGDGISLCDIGAFESPVAPNVSLTFNPAPIAPGSKTTLQITVKNLNSSKPNLTGIGFSIALPMGLEVAEPNKLINSCSRPQDILLETTTIQVANVALLSGRQCQISVDIRETGQKPITYEITTSAIVSDQTAESPSPTTTRLNVGIYSCDEAGFNQAVINGGSASFDCAQPTAIEINGDQTILSNTRLDGRGLVTLKPGRGYRIIRITSGNPLVINGMTLDGLQSIYIQSGSSLTIQNSTLTNFVSAENGGAIDVRSQAQLTIFNSSFLNNKSNKNGGAIYVENGGRATIYNSTFYGNTALQGGAIYAEAGSNVQLTNNTITANTGSGVYHANGGAANDISLVNTLLSQNNDGNCAGDAVQNSGNNLQFPGQTCGVGVPTGDPLLSPLNNNGGFTQTLALQAGSPAINQGNNSICTANGINGFDQRGYLRTGTCDIGAYEASNVQPQLRLTVPSIILVGKPIQVTAEIIDGSGNLIPGYRGTIKLSTSVVGESRLPLHTFEQKDGGKYNFIFTLRQSGPHTLKAVDTVNENISQNSSFYAYLQPIVKAAFAPSTIYGGQTCLVFQIYNPNQVALHNVILTDQLPPEAGGNPRDLVVAADTSQQCSDSNSLVNAPIGGSAITIGGSGFSLASDETQTFGVKVSTTAKTDTVITDTINSVSSTETGTISPDTHIQINVKVGAPQFTSSFLPEKIALNGHSKLYYRLYNPNGMDLTNVQFTTNLTNNLSFPISQTAQCLGNNVNLNFNSATHNLAITISAISAHQICDFTVDVQGDVASPNKLSIQSSSVTATEIDASLSSPPTPAMLTVSSNVTCNINGMQDITWQGNGLSFAQTDALFSTYISQDGRYIAFESASENFAPKDFNFASDIFVYDRTLCKMTRASEATDGTPADLGEGGDALYSVPAISASGRYVTFMSFAKNLVNPPLNCPPEVCRQVFWHDLISSSTQLISVNQGVVGDGISSQNTAVSSDGRYIAFGSQSTNLVNNVTVSGKHVNIFWRDTQTGDNKILSLKPDGTEDDADASEPEITADGRYVFFASSSAQLTAENKPGIFMVGDLQSPQPLIKLVSLKADGSPMEGALFPSITPDGRYVVFASSDQIYLRDIQASITTEVSLSKSAHEGNKQSYDPSIASVSAPTGNRQFIAFASDASNLDDSKSDTNKMSDVYVHDTCSGETKRVSVAISGETDGASYGPSISADGQWIAFGSEASNLVSYDTNGLRDVFVVPNPLRNAQCPPASPDQVFDGKLTVLQGDPQQGLHESAVSLYSLQSSDGQVSKLEFENGVLVQPSLLNKQVTVKGQKLASVADTVRVKSIEATQSPFQAQDAPVWIGSKPWLTLLCKFNGGNIPNIPGATNGSAVDTNWFNQNAMSNQYPGQNHYWRTQSYNQMNLDGSVAQGWITLQNNHDFYTDIANAPDGFINAVQDCLTLANIPNLDNYAGINFAFNEELDGYAYGGNASFKVGTVDGKPITILPPWAYFNQAALAHEIGHGLGLFHSSGPYGSPYDSRWDVMSDIWGNCPPYDVSNQDLGCVAVSLNAYHRSVLGWLDPIQVSVPAGISRTITIGRLDQSTLPANQIKMIKVPLKGSNNFYTIEVRGPACTLFGDNTTCYDAQEKWPKDNLTQVPLQGIIIHRVIPVPDLDQSLPDRPGEFDTDAIVMDCDGVKTPPCFENGNPNDAGAVWTVGETFTDKTYGIEITVTAKIANGYTVTVSNGILPSGPLAKPNLIAPINNRNLVDSSPIHFQWTVSSGSTGYEFQIGKDNPLTNGNILTGTQYNFSRLLPGTYYWRVRAVDDRDTANRVSEWSDIFTFTVQNGITTSPIRSYYIISSIPLTWSRLSWASGYEIQVDNNIEFTSPEYENNTLGAGDASITTPSLLDGIYYWRVRAKDGSGNWKGWSTIEMFAVDTNG